MVAASPLPYRLVAGRSSPPSTASSSRRRSGPCGWWRGAPPSSSPSRCSAPSATIASSASASRQSSATPAARRARPLVLAAAAVWRRQRRATVRAVPLIRSISPKRTQSTPLLTIPVVSPPPPPPPPPLEANSGNLHSSASPPNSATLTSDGQNSDPLVINTCSSAPLSPGGGGGSGAASTAATSTATVAGVAVTRPFKPYASVGACNLPLADFHLGCSIAAEFELDVADRARPAAAERVADLQRDAIVGSGQAQAQAQAKSVSLEEEEKSLQYIEVKVNKELHRRIREDEARMHSIIFQSSSWIESLSGRFGL